jgi:hypothetical protein
MKAIAVALSIMVFVFVPHCRAGTMSRYVEGASATGVNGNVKMALHMASHGAYSCKNLPVISTFSDIRRNLDSFAGEADVFMVVFDYDSLRVVEYGLTWPAEWGSASTNVCVPNALTVGGITYPGDGVAIGWTYPECRIPEGHPGGNTRPFWVTSFSWLFPTGAGEIVIKDNPMSGNSGVESCGDPASRVYTCVSHVYDGGILMPTGLYDGLPRFGNCAAASVGGPGLPTATGRLRIWSQPNPFASQAQISYEIPTGSHVTLTVYDTMGRVVRRLVDSGQEPGIHNAVWNGRDDRGQAMASGIYFCRLAAGSTVVMNAVTVVR